MRSNKKIITVFVVLLALILQSCNLPSTQPTEEIDSLAAAQLTITALSQSPTPAATSTATETVAPTAEFTSTPAITGTPTFAYLTLSEATNCRLGADVSFELVDTFQVGQTIQVLGKHPFDNYWFVKSPNNPDVSCWMWGQYATGANLNDVPVMTPPATYTPAVVATATATPGFIIIGTLTIKPAFTAAYVNSGKCTGWWSRISLKNTGTPTAKSVSISVTDTVTNEVRYATVNGFQDVNACALTPIKATLASGETTTVVAPSFVADPTGHKVSATITLCTELNATGACSTSIIEFTP